MNESLPGDPRPTARVTITGAASGVGRACALAFARLGASLVLCDYDALGLQDIAALTGGLARFCDVASESSVEILAADLLGAFPSLDILVNAAGGAYVRSLGMMRVSRLLLPGLRRGPGSKLIVNVAPGPGLATKVGLFAHAGSEAAFSRLSEAIALQTRGSAIRTATVAASAPPAVSLLERHPDPSAAIAIGLDCLDPSEAASRIVALACDHVSSLDCRALRSKPIRRAFG